MGLLNYKNYGRLWRVYGRSVWRYGSVRKMVNVARTEWAYRRRQSLVRSYPYILFLEPLYYCNLECPLCDRQIFSAARPGKEAGKLAPELFDRLLAECGCYLLQCQIFGQGEPLLDWPRTAEIIRKCHACRIYTLMSSNCILARPEVAREIVRVGLDHNCVRDRWDHAGVVREVPHAGAVCGGVSGDGEYCPRAPRCGGGASGD